VAKNGVITYGGFVRGGSPGKGGKGNDEAEMEKDLVCGDGAAERCHVWTCRVGFLLPAACFVGAAFVGCNAVLSVFLIVVAASLLGLSASCWAVNHLDLAPPFAGKFTQRFCHAFVECGLSCFS